MQAGAAMKGEFEQRLRSVIDEVQASPTPIILFIDEAHTLIGAGGQAGTGDAANLLKPALARGALAHHRRHHLGGIPAVHREGSGADPALPAGAYRRAGPGALLRHDARPARADGEASRRAHLRRGAGRGGHLLAALHSGAPAARQGGEPARHGLRAGRDQPERASPPRSRTPSVAIAGLEREKVALVRRARPRQRERGSPRGDRGGDRREAEDRSRR